MHNASKLYQKRCQQTKERADALYRILNDHQTELEQQGVEHWLLRKTIKEEKARAEAEIEEYQRRQWKAYHTNNKEFTKCEKYCREQRELLRVLEDLTQQEREMYELDNHKDQVMTVFKVALANLGMWVRDQYFPDPYAHASWQRLQAFFQLPGRIFWGREWVEVELKPFNDRALTRDLEMLCAKVAQEQLCLPDGRRLLFRIQGRGTLLLDAREKKVA
jgi:IS1 family transposase